MPSLPIDDENLPLFTVGQVATTLEVQHAFLRRLDEFGVVRPSRSAGGQRRYTRHEVTRVAYVLRLVEDGLKPCPLSAASCNWRPRFASWKGGSVRWSPSATRSRPPLASAARWWPAPRAFGIIREPERPGQPG